ncbi:MAG: type II toxin-antitoxin system RatA family toxin [Betaproteobacteria bacterium]|nr:type II toxin-antitoxin system RatA family toxin [Betaproteobacteria bacterium]
MAEVDRSVLVGFTPAQMFDLVEGVERYPEFLPWCGGATVSHRDAETTRATLLIHFRGIRQSFTTENRKQAPHGMIMRLVAGPFSRLDGSWRFTGLAGRGCKVELNLRYEFSSRLLEKVIGPVFGHIAGTLLDAFVKRAGQIYGAKQ